MAWQQVGQPTFSGDRSPILKWNSVGQSVEGVYKGTREGKFGPLAIVQTSGGETACATNKVLLDGIAKEGIQVGGRLRIEYLGKKKSQNGYEYKDFKVFSWIGPDLKILGAAPLETQLEDSIEFERLRKLIEAEKGKGIADAIAAAAKMAGDPVKSLREAMEQIGVVSF
jgi:hypothetical protein